MKKIRVIFLILAMLMVFTACGGGSTPAETTAADTTAADTTAADTTAASTTEATTAPEVKVDSWVIITAMNEVNANYWNAASYLADAIDAITGKYPDMTDDRAYNPSKYGENVGHIYLGGTKFDQTAELQALGLGAVGYAYKVFSASEVAICSATDYALVKAVKAFCADVLGYDGETVPESMELTVGAQYLYDGDYEIDLTDYELVFEDEFEGTELDLAAWEHRYVGAQSNGAFISPSQVRVEDGNAVLKYEYLEDGEFGEGWYSASFRLKERYNQGYFECRMICNDQRPNRFWSAFWLQGHHPYDALSKGGIGSAEIDIIEAFRSGADLKGPGHMSMTVHCFGYADGSESSGLRSSPTYNIEIDDIYTAYHTYALEWTATEYRFFLDGECVYELVWADGVNVEDLNEVVLTLCIPGADDLKKADRSVSGEMIVDYVRIYQIP